MGPKNNPKLFEVVTPGTLDLLKVKHERAELLASEVKKLCEYFDALTQKGRAGQAVGDPTVFAKLFALSHLENSSLSLVGLYDLRGTASRIKDGEPALVAPFHDQDRLDDGTLIGTRFIKYRSSDSDIHVIGLNIDVVNEKDSAFDAVIGTTDKATNGTSPLLLVGVGNSGGVVEKGAVGGETPIIIVWNKKANDVKAYAIERNEEETLKPMEARDHIHVGKLEVNIPLPDGIVMNIKQLSGEQEEAVITEVVRATNHYETEKPTEALTKEERAVLKDIG